MANAALNGLKGGVDESSIGQLSQMIRGDGKSSPTDQQQQGLNTQGGNVAGVGPVAATSSTDAPAQTQTQALLQSLVQQETRKALSPPAGPATRGIPQNQALEEAEEYNPRKTYSPDVLSRLESSIY